MFNNSRIEKLERRIEELEKTSKLTQIKDRPSFIYNPYMDSSRMFEEYPLWRVVELLVRHLDLKLVKETTPASSETKLVPLDTIKVNKPKKA